MTAQDLLDTIGKQNPYNRQNKDLRLCYYMYNVGWMASFIASACKDDPKLRILLKKTLEKTRPRC